jgi:hypothetical protein
MGKGMHFSMKTLKVTDHLEDTEVDGKIILKYILETMISG